MAQNRSIGWISLALAILLLIGGPIIAALQQDFKADAGITYADVTETWTERDLNRSTHMMRIRYTVDGVDYEAVRSHTGNRTVGSTIRLFYNADNPIMFELESDQTHVVFLWLVMVGLLSVSAFLNLWAKNA